jgi:hypothetical protein
MGKATGAVNEVKVTDLVHAKGVRFPLQQQPNNIQMSTLCRMMQRGVCPLQAKQVQRVIMGMATENTTGRFVRLSTLSIASIRAPCRKHMNTIAMLPRAAPIMSGFMPNWKRGKTNCSTRCGDVHGLAASAPHPQPLYHGLPLTWPVHANPQRELPQSALGPSLFQCN